MDHRRGTEVDGSVANVTALLGGREFDYRIFEDLCAGLLDAQQDLKYLRLQVSSEANDRIEQKVRLLQSELRDKLKLLRDEQRDKVDDMRIALRLQMMQILQDKNYENEIRIEEYQRMKARELGDFIELEAKEIQTMVQKIEEMDSNINQLYLQSCAYTEHINMIQEELSAVEKMMTTNVGKHKEREKESELFIQNLKSQVEKRDVAISELRKMKEAIEEENSGHVDRAEFQMLKEEYMTKISDAKTENARLRDEYEELSQSLAELEGHKKTKPSGPTLTRSKDGSSPKRGNGKNSSNYDDK